MIRLNGQEDRLDKFIDLLFNVLLVNERPGFVVKICSSLIDKNNQWTQLRETDLLEKLVEEMSIERSNFEEIR